MFIHFIDNIEVSYHKFGLIKYWLLLLDDNNFFTIICVNWTYFVSSFHNLILISKHGLD